MKEKRLKYILFVVVGAIWGFTIYKYFFYTPDQGNTPVVQAISGAAPDAVKAEAQPFQLLEEYRDPFLSRTKGFSAPKEDAAPGFQGSAPLPQRIATRPKVSEIPPPINWKQFRYLGLVEESKGARQVGLLSVDGKLQSVEVGGKYRHLEILWMDADSMRIRHQEIEKNIGR